MLERFGDRATDSPFERQFYARDLAYVPEALLKAVAKPLPDVVIRPIDCDEVAEILGYANDHGIAVTTRAGGSTAYGNAVPARAGILLDMNSFQGVGEVDDEALTVSVAPGTTWLDLDRVLNRQGCAVCSYPSSARVATVGGWFSMGGLGIGSLKYGPLEQLVEDIEVVLPGGEIRRLDRDTTPPCDWFAGAEGTLGVVTRVRLEVRRHPEHEVHYLVECRDAGAATELAALVTERFPGFVFNAHINSDSYNDLMSTLGYPGYPPGKPTLTIDLEGTQSQLEDCDAEIRRQATGCEATVHGDDAALEHWESRFDSLRIKRQSPGLLGAELVLPLDKFDEYLRLCASLAEEQKTKIPSYGHVVNDGRVLVMSLVPTDERKAARYLVDTSILNRIYDIGARVGGAPYAIGLWNTPYLKKAHDRATLRQLKRRKALLDPKGIMNPGKYYAAPPLLHPSLVAFGMHSLAWIRKRSTRRENP
jgi:glycolate oxidase